MTRCATVTVLGPPNAGKSTLVNHLTGGKVSIVTPKPQTTRVRVRGMCVEGAAQLVLTDTPGIFAAAQAFEKNMVREAWAGAGEADMALLVLDASRGLDEDALAIIEKLPKKIPVALALNKIDAVKKPYLLALATAASAAFNFAQIFMISAKTGSGVADIRKWLAERAPEGPWLYPADAMTDQPARALAAELTREQLFLALRQELPYSLTVETELWEEGKPVRIVQIIRVERESQKKIVIGAGGAMLKQVGTQARKVIGEMLGQPVRLELFVKVDAKWKEG